MPERTEMASDMAGTTAMMVPDAVRIIRRFAKYFTVAAALTIGVAVVVGGSAVLGASVGVSLMPGETNGSESPDQVFYGIVGGLVGFSAGVAVIAAGVFLWARRRARRELRPFYASLTNAR